jgi:hypothetical protein
VCTRKKNVRAPLAAPETAPDVRPKRARFTTRQRLEQAVAAASEREMPAARRIGTVSRDLPLRDVQRFLAKVELAPNGCWLWKGQTIEEAHGARYAQIRYNGANVVVHRAAYEIFVGHVLAGYVVDHLCGNTRCVNPDHLEAVVMLDNIRRGLRWTKAKRLAAKKTHCKRGHPMSGQNLIVFVRPNGYVDRKCRACAALRGREYRRRHGHLPPQGEAYPGPISVFADPVIASQLSLAQAIRSSKKAHRLGE